MAPQHAGLTPERWAGFSRDQQLLMIGNELHRASKLLDEGGQRLLACYERALALADLTIATQQAPGFRRELLRWRDLLATLYLEPHPTSADPLQRALKALLMLDPIAYRQVPYVL